MLFEADFSEYQDTYLERFVEHDPLSDEAISRCRRHSAFINTTGFIEEPWIPYSKHKKIIKSISRALYHVSFQSLGGRHKIPFALTEPNRREGIKVRTVE